jgi:hypothetical protein
LVLVEHEESDFGAIALWAICADDVSAATDELLRTSSYSCDQSYVVNEINVGELGGFTLAWRSSEAVKAKAYRFRTQMDELLAQRAAIVTMDGPNDNRYTVT